MTSLPEDGAPASSDVDVTQATSRTAKPSISIGPYRLLERIGEGGMGEVWLAEQARPVQRQVALKVIKAGMDTAQVIARFDAERQALALMDHPSIARVFDGGATPEGRPYFVMEFVRGESITAYAIRHKLPLRGRIELFMQVCEGVQHAHQKGIIHRDLKPSNVLVTSRDDRAVPKIIDFGVAKATTHSLTDRTLHTELGALVGTPEYMSPEQAEMGGLDIDTRTDVYALGVVLYELLTDTLPFDPKTLREKPLDEIRRVIREVDPPRPSTRVTAIAKQGIGFPDPARPSNCAGELRGDLDWITMRALEKDRTRRYGSASDFAADLRRHLDNLPVLASPPTTVYRVRKFIRRHRFGVATAVASFVMLVAFVAMMAAQERRTAHERDRANLEAVASKQIADFLIGLFAVSDPSEARGNTLTAREILDKGAREIDRTLATQPKIRARLEAAIGTVYTNLGSFTAAAPLLERAVKTDLQQLGAQHLDTLTAMHALANVYWYQDRLADAEQLYLAVIERRSQALGEDHRDTLRANYDLASLYIVEQRWKEAEGLQVNTLERQRHALGNEDPDVLDSMNNLASAYYQQRRFSDAQPLYLGTLATSRRVLGDDHPSTLNRLHNLATNFEAMSATRDAEKAYVEALSRRKRVLGDTHPETINTERRLGLFYLRSGRYDEAEALLTAAYAGDVARGGASSASAGRDARAIADLFDAWGRPTKAAEWRAKLLSEMQSKP